MKIPVDFRREINGIAWEYPSNMYKVENALAFPALITVVDLTPISYLSLIFIYRTPNTDLTFILL